MEELRQLREALAAAEARAAALEASKAAAEDRAAALEASKAALEASKAVAEASKAAAEDRAAALEASKAAAEASLAASLEKVYFTQLRAVTGSASENSSVSADTARRGAPEVEEVSLDAFFNGWPPVATDRVAAAWSEARCLLAARVPLELTFEGALEEQAERSFVHSLMLPLLQALTSCVSDLRLWHEATIADSIPLAEACPDVTWTHARDVSASSLGALLCLELKRWGESRLPLVRARLSRRTPPALSDAPSLAGMHSGGELHEAYRRTAGARGSRSRRAAVLNRSALRGVRWLARCPPACPLRRAGGWGLQYGATVPHRAHARAGAARRLGSSEACRCDGDAAGRLRRPPAPAVRPRGAVERLRGAAHCRTPRVRALIRSHCTGPAAWLRRERGCLRGCASYHGRASRPQTSPLQLLKRREIDEDGGGGVACTCFFAHWHAAQAIGRG